jgi:hypothetical protein
VWRYDATAADLHDLHETMHDPTRNDETVVRIRAMLGLDAFGGCDWDDATG